jgi:hypothetical protein
MCEALIPKAQSAQIALRPVDTVGKSRLPSWRPEIAAAASTAPKADSGKKLSARFPTLECYSITLQHTLSGAESEYVSMPEQQQPRINAPKTRGRPFQPGNPGRPRGSRGKATVAAQVLLDGEAKTLTRKAIDLAKEGDTTALRLCLERIVPPRKDRPVSFAIPLIANANEAASLMSALVAAVASGAVMPSEASEVAKVIAGYVEALKTSELENRLRLLEEARSNDAF